MRRLVLLAALALAACGTHPDGPASIEVRVEHDPVPVPCKPDLGPAPAYPDTPAAIAAAPNLAERARLYAAGRLLRQARERELQAALEKCRTLPPVR